MEGERKERREREGEVQKAHILQHLLDLIVLLRQALHRKPKEPLRAFMRSEKPSETGILRHTREEGEGHLHRILAEVGREELDREAVVGKV